MLLRSGKLLFALLFDSLEKSSCCSVASVSAHLRRHILLKRKVLRAVEFFAVEQRLSVEYVRLYRLGRLARSFRAWDGPGCGAKTPLPSICPYIHIILDLRYSVNTPSRDAYNRSDLPRAFTRQADQTRNEFFHCRRRRCWVHEDDFCCTKIRQYQRHCRC